jgi:mono/diheme cytochrome c family protein
MRIPSPIRAHRRGRRLPSVFALLAALWFAGPVAGAEAEDEYEGLPPGEGRDHVYTFCGACHSVKLLVQQGLSRDTWDELIVWMVEEQGMAELDEETHKIILDYLDEHLNTDHRAPHMKR